MSPRCRRPDDAARRDDRANPRGARGHLPRRHASVGLQREASAEGPAKTTHATGPTTGTSSAGPTIVTIPSAGAEVFFAQWTPEGRPGGLAVNSGELVLDEKGCLRLRYRGDYSLVPVWPPDYEPKASDGGEIRVLNGKGRVVARFGERVVVGGNPLDSPTKASYLVGGQTTLRELRERCPGAYWVASRAIDAREIRQR